MKKILSERNIAGVLFILVIAVFAFAHEDSKKRNNHYNASAPRIAVSNTTGSIAEVAGNLTPESAPKNLKK
jgi:hypothetical protein